MSTRAMFTNAFKYLVNLCTVPDFDLCCSRHEFVVFVVKFNSFGILGGFGSAVFLDCAENAL